MSTNGVFLSVVQGSSGSVTTTLYFDSDYLASVPTGSDTAFLEVDFASGPGGVSGAFCSNTHSTLVHPFYPCPPNMNAAACLPVPCLTGTVPTDGQYTFIAKFSVCPADNSKCGNDQQISAAVTLSASSSLASKAAANSVGPSGGSTSSSGGSSFVPYIAGGAAGLVAVGALSFFVMRRRTGQEQHNKMANFYSEELESHKIEGNLQPSPLHSNNGSVRVIAESNQANVNSNTNSNNYSRAPRDIAKTPQSAVAGRPPSDNARSSPPRVSPISSQNQRIPAALPPYSNEYSVQQFRNGNVVHQISNMDNAAQQANYNSSYPSRPPTQRPPSNNTSASVVRHGSVPERNLEDSINFQQGTPGEQLQPEQTAYGASSYLKFTESTFTDFGYGQDSPFSKEFEQLGETSEYDFISHPTVTTASFAAPTSSNQYGFGSLGAPAPIQQQQQFGFQGYAQQQMPSQPLYGQQHMGQNYPIQNYPGQQYEQYGGQQNPGQGQSYPGQEQNQYYFSGQN